MKAIILFFLIFPFLSFSQNRANIWQLAWNTPGHNLGLDFNSGTVETFLSNRWLKMYNTNASICDQDGNMLFYTNGKFIANRNDDTLLTVGISIQVMLLMGDTEMEFTEAL